MRPASRRLPGGSPGAPAQDRRRIDERSQQCPAARSERGRRRKRGEHSGMTPIPEQPLVEQTALQRMAGEDQRHCRSRVRIPQRPGQWLRADSMPDKRVRDVLAPRPARSCPQAEVGVLATVGELLGEATQALEQRAWIRHVAGLIPIALPRHLLAYGRTGHEMGLIGVRLGPSRQSSEPEI